jgi:hypothetical protein
LLQVPLALALVAFDLEQPLLALAVVALALLAQVAAQSALLALAVCAFALLAQEPSALAVCALALLAQEPSALAVVVVALDLLPQAMMGLVPTKARAPTRSTAAAMMMKFFFILILLKDVG